MNCAKPRLWLTLGAASLLLIGISGSADAQLDGGESCKCGVAAACVKGAQEKITNLLSPKPPDLVLCATNAAPGACEAVWANNNPKRVSSVQEAIDEIRAAALGGPINVFVDGHGNSGVQCFGPDNECIGNNQPYVVNKEKFIQGLRGKIKTLTLIGCSAASAPKGQGFLEKLAAELEANFVRGFTGTNWVKYEWGGDATNRPCQAFPGCSDEQGLCEDKEVCTSVDTNSDNTDDACRCRPVKAKAGGYWTEGVKRVKAPALSEWGLAVSTLLLLTGITIRFALRRPSKTV